ncbi:hypothetical protein [Janthinobacterium sp. 17J80-10]|uniref:hypothetical protein n=1 Tax=Janthinobacterium sp. 17J80-10 TaxID=2497863 RepID=UPI0010052E72|nr:hypothetical protein [Janthinobacterium sp. 17J80-10]QAU32798.1 hypothetical protein EKL02_00660 [Janthinobacterium sp. 17J80-10]
MASEQDWQTELYKDMEIYVTALPHEGSRACWDYAVRIAWPGEDPSSDSEVIGESGDDGDYPNRAAAIQAGFIKGHVLVDGLSK